MEGINMRYLVPGIFLLVCNFAHAESISCKVVGIADGDTLTCLTNERQQLKVRLAEIDAPEKDQPWGQKSKLALSDLVYGKDVSLEVADTDRYGRKVAHILVNGQDANRAQVANGNAWVYRQYLRDHSLLSVESEAKAASRGLWGLQEDQRMPPWEWRHGGKKPARTATVRPSQPVDRQRESASSGLSCGSKRTCREMSSCAEAQFYLNQCGLSRLDRDHDGVACDKDCQ